MSIHGSRTRGNFSWKDKSGSFEHERLYIGGFVFLGLGIAAYEGAKACYRSPVVRQRVRDSAKFACAVLERAGRRFRAAA